VTDGSNGLDAEPIIEFRASYEFGPPDPEALSRMNARRGAGELGFLDLPRDRDLLDASVGASVDTARECRNMVVAGIGGSSLGLRALLAALVPGEERVTVIDSPDSRLLERVTGRLDPETTAVTVITKSGGTAETMAVFMGLHEWLPAGLRDRRITAVTDPGNGDLRRMATERGWRTLPVPPSVGGRFSVLSPVGMYPAAFAGIDVYALAGGASLAADDFDLNGTGSTAAAVSAAFTSRFATHPVHVFMPYTDLLWETALWFSQLWAESLSKARDLDGSPAAAGQTPLACRGPADQHSLLQLFMEGPPDKAVTIVTVDDDAGKDGEGAADGFFSGYSSTGYLCGRSPDILRNTEASATGMALQERGLPVDYIRLSRLAPGTMGRLLMVLETATALTGFSLNVNPMDQPGVERSKVLTYGAMGRPGY
jgi:glucose-6-phosphate isomerase